MFKKKKKEEHNTMARQNDVREFYKFFNKKNI